MAAKMDRGDRDLLIELKTEMVAVKEAIKDLTDNTKEIITDHETRLRFVERYMWLAIGMVALAEFALTYFHH